MNISGLFSILSNLFSKKNTTTIYSGNENNNVKVIRIPVAQYFDPAKYGKYKFNGIVLHHSLTKDGTYKDSDSIARYHTSYRIDGEIVTEEEFNRRKEKGFGKHFEKPWSAIGYHALIEKVNGVLTTVDGRDWGVAGAHSGVVYNNKVYGDYNKWFGLCIVGNFDNSEPEAELWNYTIDVCRELCFNFNIPINNVIGHREVFQKFNVPVQKSCPGFKFNLDKFRNNLRDRMYEVYNK